MISIVDYGMGNLGSILSMFKRIGVGAKLVTDLEELSKADKILLPGVGAFDHAMERINGSGLREILDNKALKERVPILGICLGMQLLTRGSEEGKLSGLGWIAADTIKFPLADGLKVPHMGWNNVIFSGSNPLVNNLSEESRYYFVHSYYVQVDNQKNSMLKTKYDLTFDSAIQQDNILGVQFHPEKSHKFGMQLLKIFSDI